METPSSGRWRRRPSPGPTFDLAVPIRRPPPVVFALLADVQDAEPIPRSAAVRMVKDPAGPTAVGTRWHERVRVGPWCWLHVESVVTAVREPYLLAMNFRSRWLSGSLVYEIDPTADGSVLRQRETVRARVLPRWLGPALARRMRPRLEERLADIRTILEEAP